LSEDNQLFHFETNDKRWEVDPAEAKILIETRAKFFDVFALKFASLSQSTKLFRVICRSWKYFYYLPPHQTFIVICLFPRLIGRKTTTAKSRFINVTDAQSYSAAY